MNDPERLQAPFPYATPAQAAEIAALAKELDALHKALLAAHFT